LVEQIYLELLRCDPEVREDEAVVHASAVIKAEARQDPHAFFRVRPHTSLFTQSHIYRYKF
jgi:hypothetical protein